MDDADAVTPRDARAEQVGQRRTARGTRLAADDSSHDDALADDVWPQPVLADTLADTSGDHMVGFLRSGHVVILG
ncbi:hypothetical protein NPS01_40390 [Nocardioides psychrotolerans]|nr:hypothetical protein NPS01_40390 [Nocardioides psychrotolerans]